MKLYVGCSSTGMGIFTLRLRLAMKLGNVELVSDISFSRHKDRSSVYCSFQRAARVFLREPSGL